MPSTPESKPCCEEQPCSGDHRQLPASSSASDGSTWGEQLCGDVGSILPLVAVVGR